MTNPSRIQMRTRVLDQPDPIEEHEVDNEGDNQVPEVEAHQSHNFAANPIQCQENDRYTCQRPGKRSDLHHCAGRVAPPWKLQDNACEAHHATEDIIGQVTNKNCLHCTLKRQAAAAYSQAHQRGTSPMSLIFSKVSDELI
mmetsp:Transcript_80683/g.125716  ORF Transcript_80683/g.125716 Transcript_80683/m.125716 type:complete len:141 (-) Transcript_80683:21-443(-)